MDPQCKVRTHLSARIEVGLADPQVLPTYSKTLLCPVPFEQWTDGQVHKSSVWHEIENTHCLTQNYGPGMASETLVFAMPWKLPSWADLLFQVKH